jgi:hypothetical protein
MKTTYSVQFSDDQGETWVNSVNSFLTKKEAIQETLELLSIQPRMKLRVVSKSEWFIIQVKCFRWIHSPKLFRWEEETESDIFNYSVVSRNLKFSTFKKAQDHARAHYKKMEYRIVACSTERIVA